MHKPQYKTAMAFHTKVLGLMVASFSAIEYGKLFYRTIERSKVDALRDCCGNFDCYMNVNSDMKVELSWWIENVQYQDRKINHGKFDIMIQSDASLLGWGAVMNNVHTGGRWGAGECNNHINYLELLACFLSLKSFCKEKSNIHVKIMMDSTTAVSYVNNMGGIASLKLDKLAKNIWLWCKQRNIWLTGGHIPGKVN